jgi:nitrate/nitrite-specific signal transduction histidine kinase
MRERAQRVGAQLCVASCAAGGCRVETILPLA